MPGRHLLPPLRAALLVAALTSAVAAGAPGGAPPAKAPAGELFAAVGSGKLDRVKELVRRDRTLLNALQTTAAGEAGMNPLGFAVLSGQRSVAKFLFHSGSSPVHGRPTALGLARQLRDAGLTALFESRAEPPAEGTYPAPSSRPPDAGSPAADGLPVPDEVPLLNMRVLEFCRRSLGRTVGSGQCAELAQTALAAAGAIPRLRDFPQAGDYVWGDPVCVIQAGGRGPVVQPAAGRQAQARILPGDVVQYRDVELQGRVGKLVYTTTAPHHTSVVESASPDGMELRVLEQNSGTALHVVRGTLNLADLKRGTLRVYRPVPR